MRFAYGVGALVCGLVAGGAALLLRDLREHDLADARRELATLNAVLAEETTRTFQGVDLVLKSVLEGLQAEGIDTGEDLARIKGDQATSLDLKAKAAGLPQLDAVTIISADGRLVNFSRFWPIPAVNVSDRDYFAHLRDRTDATPFLSEPIENRGTGTWTIYLARRIAGPDGAFIGIVLGAIDLAYFDRFYRSLDLGAQSAISLWRRDGMLLTREPALPDVGRRFPIRSFDAAFLASGEKVYQTPASIDGFARIVATRAVRDYPLVINVTRSLEEILAGWRRFVGLIGAMVAAAFAATALILWTLARRAQADARAVRLTHEREAAIEARDQAESRLQQAQRLEAVGQLTAGVAHDFNNLLTVVLGNAEFLARDLARAGIEGRPAARLAQMRQAAERGAKLTAQLLAFARRQRLAPRPLDLNGTLTGMEDLLRSTVGSATQVRVVPGPGLWPAIVDPTQLELVILNLAINARDAMPEGGTVTVATANATRHGEALHPGEPQPGEYVAVSVADTGTGMSEAVLARAFEPFFTTKEVGRGTGLGLAQVYGFAQQSGGGITIETRAGEGTRVTVFLPRSAVAVESPAPAAPPVAVAAPSARAPRILLVDDDAGVREIAAKHLRASGHVAIEAGDGPTALDLLEREPAFDAMLLDFAMPGMNGAEVARAVRRTRPEMPIVFVTGYADLTAIAAVARHGIVQKPFGADALVGALRGALSQPRA